MQELRRACAIVSAQARHVRIRLDEIAPYALRLPPIPPEPDDGGAAIGDRAQRAAFWITLDAINFGSGWFPTLRKPPGHSGYATVAAGVRQRFARHGNWSSAELAGMSPAEIANTLGQDPGHPLMGLFARSLRDLGAHLREEHGGDFLALAGSTGGAAVPLAQRLGAWDCFADAAWYGELRVPFLKRAQIAAADLARAGVIAAPDLAGLTMFADNLVPHVLRLDGILEFDPELVERIEREELIEPGSAEEVEIRACALHAVELIVAARPGTCAAQVDQLLWLRGQGRRYKSRPRHRSRCTAY
jgi:hypothetical protein